MSNQTLDKVFLVVTKEYARTWNQDQRLFTSFSAAAEYVEEAVGSLEYDDVVVREYHLENGELVDRSGKEVEDLYWVTKHPINVQITIVD